MVPPCPLLSVWQVGGEASRAAHVGAGGEPVIDPG